MIRRAPLERVATAVIAAGVFMLLQPFSMSLYSWSFVTTLAGTAMFMIVSRLPHQIPSQRARRRGERSSQKGPN